MCEIQRNVIGEFYGKSVLIGTHVNFMPIGRFIKRILRLAHVSYVSHMKGGHTAKP